MRAAGRFLPALVHLTVADVGDIPAANEPPEVCRALGVRAPSGGAQAFCVVLFDAAGNAGSGDCTQPVRIVASGLK